MSKNPKPLAVALPRVSTDKQFYQGDSIETQITKIDMAAKRGGVEIVRYFVEHYSGRKTERAVIDDLLTFLDRNPEIKIVYIVQIDRFSRAGPEGYLHLKRKLYQRGVELRDVMGIIQKANNSLAHLDVEYDWSVRSPSQTSEVIHAEYANLDVVNILTRTIGQQIAMERKGYQTRPPDFGFANKRIDTPEGKQATIMVPLEPEATWIRAIFKLRAECKLSDPEICDRINAMGYAGRTRKKHDPKTGKVIGTTRKRELYPVLLQQYVRRTIYCGIRKGKWTEGKAIKTKFDGLVSVELFNKANRGAKQISENSDGTISVCTGESRIKACHKHNSEFLLRHVVHCPACDKPFLASKSRSKSGKYFGYFHCARGHKSVRVPQHEFHTITGNYLESLKAKPGFLGWFREVVRETWVAKNKNRLGELAAIDEYIATLRERQDNILERIAVSSSVIVQAKLEREVEQLEAQILKAQRERESSSLTEQQIEQFFNLAKDRMEHPKKYALGGVTKIEMDKIWGTIFTRPPSYLDLLDGTPDLRLIYRLNRSFASDQKVLASRIAMNWNTFVDDVKNWL